MQQRYAVANAGWAGGDWYAKSTRRDRHADRTERHRYPDGTQGFGHARNWALRLASNRALRLASNRALRLASN